LLLLVVSWLKVAHVAVHLARGVKGLWSEPVSIKYRKLQNLRWLDRLNWLCTSIFIIPSKRRVGGLEELGDEWGRWCEARACFLECLWSWECDEWGRWREAKTYFLSCLWCSWWEGVLGRWRMREMAWWGWRKQRLTFCQVCGAHGGRRR